MKTRTILILGIITGLLMIAFGSIVYVFYEKITSIEKRVGYLEKELKNYSFTCEQ